jgi:NAD(P)-dependent dehydrogenase (short-subunit alcohol dehydrogenase family)
MNHGLTDRVVVITGAGSGIGLATCRVALEEGATIVAGDLDPSAAAALSDAVTAVTVDLSTAAGAEQLISAGCSPTSWRPPAQTDHPHQKCEARTR